MPPSTAAIYRQRSPQGPERITRPGRSQGRLGSEQGGRPARRADLKALVKLRNEAAHKLGFADYHKLQLFLNEQTQDQVLKLFDELDDLTREPFRKLKLEIDGKLAEQSGVADRRPSALALPRSILSGSACDLRRRFRLGVCEGRHPQALPRFLRGHRLADRRRDRPQRPL